MNEELRKLKEEKAERLKWELYRINPLFWLSDRFEEDPKSFEWSKIDGYENHEWDGDEDPLANAWKRLGKSYNEVKKGLLPTYRYVAIESATGTGKTYWLARLVFWFLDCFDNSLVVTSAPKTDQLKMGLWSEIDMISHKIKKLRPESSMYKLRLAMDETDIKDLDEDEISKSASWHAVGFIAGTGSEEQSANRARGFHRKNMLIILEECTGIAMPIITAFQNTSTGLTNFIVAVGNPDNEFDPLHQFSLQKDVESYRISAYDYPNIVLDREYYVGAVTRASIKSRADVYGEGSPLYNAMVRGISPTQSTDSLIRLEWIENCINKEFSEDELFGYNAVGVDVANSEAGDKAALAWGVGNSLVEVQEFYCRNATHLAYNLFMSDVELASNGYDDYNTKKISDFGIRSDFIGVDAVGVGVATVNAFADYGLAIQGLQGGYWEEGIPKDNNTGGLLYRFSSLRSQMYWELREDIRKAKIQIRISDKMLLNQLKKELTIPKFEASNAYITVEQKESIKKRLGGKSPNIADAVAYWNWVRKGYRASNFFFAAISSGSDFR